MAAITMQIARSAIAPGMVNVFNAAMKSVISIALSCGIERRLHILDESFHTIYVFRHRQRRKRGHYGVDRLLVFLIHGV